MNAQSNTNAEVAVLAAFVTCLLQTETSAAMVVACTQLTCILHWVMCTFLSMVIALSLAAAGVFTQDWLLTNPIWQFS